jgi:hypothetical protein
MKGKIENKKFNPRAVIAGGSVNLIFVLRLFEIS